MKITFTLIFLTSYFVFSQTKQTDVTLPDLKSLTIKSTFVIKPINFNVLNKKTNFLTVYNSDLNLHVNYYLVEKKTNDFSFQNQNTPVFNKKDSFNPYGANSIGSALIIGVLNYILD